MNHDCDFSLDEYLDLQRQQNGEDIVSILGWIEVSVIGVTDR